MMVGWVAVVAVLVWMAGTCAWEAWRWSVVAVRCRWCGQAVPVADYFDSRCSTGGGHHWMGQHTEAELLTRRDLRRERAAAR